MTQNALTVEPDLQEFYLGRKWLRKQYAHLVPVEQTSFYDAYDQKGRVLRYCVTLSMISEVQEAVQRDDLSDVVRLLTPSELPCWEGYRRACAGDIRTLQESIERMEELRN